MEGSSRQQNQSVHGHRPQQAFGVDIDRRLFVEVHEVLGGSLKRFATLIVRLKLKSRDAATRVSNKHRFDRIRQAVLDGRAKNQFTGDHSGPARALVARLTDKKRLHDVADVLACVTSDPPISGVIELFAFPPIRVQTRQVKSVFVAASDRFARPVTAEQCALFVVLSVREELQLLLVLRTNIWRFKVGLNLIPRLASLDLLQGRQQADLVLPIQLIDILRQ